MKVDQLVSLAWPAAQLGEALESLARQSGLAGDAESPEVPGGTLADGQQLDAWVCSAAAISGFEAEPVEAPYSELEGLVRGGAPALLRLSGEPRFIALLATRRGTATIIGCDRARHKVPVETVRHALCRNMEQQVGPGIDALLERARVPRRRRARARNTILGDRLSAARMTGSYLLRMPPGDSFLRQLRQARMPRYLLAFLGGHMVQYLVMMLAWWVIGRSALKGDLDHGWMVAWALLLITVIPFQLLVMWSQGRLAIGAGGLLKQRLLFGALKLDPEEIRHQGAGQLLGRVMESGAVESMALSAGLLGVLSLVELALAASVLVLGAGGGIHGVLLLATVAGALALGWQQYRRSGAWTESRLEMTHDLVERMVGHRTRLVQERRERWHDGEDQALERYMELSTRLDHTSIWLSGVVQRGWMILGVVGLAPAFISGQGSATTLAVGLGGVILASQALSKLVGSMSSITGVAIAWRQVAPLYHAAARHRERSSAAALASLSERPKDQPVVEAQEVVFRYRQQGAPVLRGCSLNINPRDRLLLEGPSGGGKSTLASVLTGIRKPESGLLLAGGLDMQTLGLEGWRRAVVAAPQFHENHVLTGTFAFNLLMGRRWPATGEDLAEAESICRELGLGALLDRMPAGLQQVVGDTGWRLSHGERSRLFMARALLQGADLVVLDESFAALDPESLDCALRCVLQRSPALLVIAHP